MAFLINYIKGNFVHSISLPSPIFNLTRLSSPPLSLSTLLCSFSLNPTSPLPFSPISHRPLCRRRDSIFSSSSNSSHVYISLLVSTEIQRVGGTDPACQRRGGGLRWTIRNGTCVEDLDMLRKWRMEVVVVQIRPWRHRIQRNVGCLFSIHVQIASEQFPDTFSNISLGWTISLT